MSKRSYLRRKADWLIVVAAFVVGIAFGVLLCSNAAHLKFDYGDFHFSLDSHEGKHIVEEKQ